MKYRMINKELRIADISISDLTVYHVQHFLSQWDDGSQIGTLTLFHDAKADLVVLNRDSKNYKTYLGIAERILSASEEDLVKLQNEAPENLADTVRVVIECRRIRLAQGEIFKALHNMIDRKYRPVLNHVSKTESISSCAAIAFRYGMMCGKREERARRKKQ